MSSRRGAILLDWVNAVALWIALAFSLGWYHVFSSYGRAGWPLPSVETFGGRLLYLFSALETRPGIQVMYWMAVFPIAGLIWVGLLSLTAPYFGGRNASGHGSLVRFALASLPLSLPGPYLAYNAGSARGNWNIHVMLEVALRGGNETPLRAGLSLLYLGLALLAFACHLYVYRQVFGLAGKAAWTHFVLTGLLFIVVAVGLGSLAAFPLGYIFGASLAVS